MGKRTLQWAAVYNILWGTWVVLFPKQFYTWVNIPAPDPIFLWQGMGMVLACYGLAYWWASYHPVHYWPIVMVGFLGKIFGPIGFFINFLSGNADLNYLYMLFFNDFIWWIPFGMILKRAYEANWPLVKQSDQ